MIDGGFLHQQGWKLREKKSFTKEMSSKVEAFYQNTAAQNQSKTIRLGNEAVLLRRGAVLKSVAHPAPATYPFNLESCESSIKKRPRLFQMKVETSLIKPRQINSHSQRAFVKS